MQLTILASPFFSAFLYVIHPFYCLFPTNPQPQSILLNNAALSVPELTLCLSLCRMISTGRSRGRTRPCLTRWWYSSARWSVSCSHGGYSDCWHWNERGGKPRKKRWKREAECCKHHRRWKGQERSWEKKQAAVWIMLKKLDGRVKIAALGSKREKRQRAER